MLTVALLGTPCYYWVKPIFAFRTNELFSLSKVLETGQQFEMIYAL